MFRDSMDADQMQRTFQSAEETFTGGSLPTGMARPGDGLRYLGYRGLYCMPKISTWRTHTYAKIGCIQATSSASRRQRALSMCTSPRRLLKKGGFAI
eukprot:16104861-Heterocapsa_arctica.AAC.1